jgi:hypothetical protein
VQCRTSEDGRKEWEKNTEKVQKNLFEKTLDEIQIGVSE